jgi:photosynthetic reaction center H subunit
MDRQPERIDRDREVVRADSVRTGGTPANASHRLDRLSDLDDYKVADGDPDIRGWDVKTPDGRKVGKVDELVVDTSEMRVRYMDVKVDKKVLGADDDGHVLVPIGTARLNDDEDDVLIDRLPASGFAAGTHERGRPITREHETALRSTYGDSRYAGSDDDFYADELYDDRRFWGARRKGREDSGYIARNEL